MSEEKKPRLRVRKRSEILDEFLKKEEENPKVERLEDRPKLNLTKREHTKELQEILVQTCINYIKEHDLKDIDAVYFSFDGAQASVEYGEWCPCSDSSIRLKGMSAERWKRKDGSIWEMPYWYDIDSYC